MFDTKYMFSNLKQNVSGFHKYDNFTLITRRLQRLVCFALNNYVHVLMIWVLNKNLVLVLRGTGQAQLPPAVRQMSARFSRKNKTGPERAVEIKLNQA